MQRKVVVKGGGANLYRVSESNGTFHVYKVSVWGSDSAIGTARRLEDALALIRSHSGREIERIE